jgi:septal ring-binding cell division protein DamX
MLRNIASLGGLIAVGVAAALAGPPAHAADATSPAAKSIYLKDRADCEAGRTAEDLATCLKEAGAAQDERKHNRLDNTGSLRQNAIERCNVLPPRDKTDCLARIEGASASNQKTTTSGSVAGGGVLRETTTTTTGQPTIIIIPGSNAASAPR